MIYLTGAVVVYLFTAIELLRRARPESFREALGGALACAVVAAFWPIAIVWRALLGGRPQRPTPTPTPSAQRERASAPRQREA